MSLTVGTIGNVNRSSYSNKIAFKGGETPEKPMLTYAGKPINTIGEFGNTLAEIATKGTKEDAERFLAEYRKACPDENIIRSNIGYVSGYYDRATMSKIQEVFDVAHPIFGKTLPTAEEALRAGIQMGKKLRK